MADTWTPFLSGLSFLESNQNPQAGNTKSSAKGAFQFLDGTAKEAMKRGLPNPQSGSYDDQASATQQYIRAINPQAAQAIDAGDYNAAIRGLKGTWPSLPGGSQPQSETRYNKFQSLLGGNVDMPSPDQTGENTLALLGRSPPRESDWSNPLIQAGASLMAINNPTGAAALGSLSNQNLTQNREAFQSALALQKMHQDAYEKEQDRQLQLRKQIAVPGILGANLKPEFAGGVPSSPTSGKGDISDDEFMAGQQWAAENPTASRDEKIKHYPVAMQGFLTSYLNGQIPASGMGMGSKIPGAARLAGPQIEPGFNDQVYGARKEMWNSLYDTKSPNSMGTQFNTLGALAHQGDEVHDAFKALSPSEWKIINQTKNFFAENFGGEGQQNLRRVQTAVNNYTDKVSKYLSGTGRPSQWDEARRAGTLGPNSSMEGVEGSLGADARMISQQGSELEDNWKRRMQMELPGGTVSDKARESLANQSKWGLQQQTTAPPATIDWNKYH